MHYIEYVNGTHLNVIAHDLRVNAFYALLFALLREADSDNLAKLEEAFPEAVKEFRQRYMAPGGILPEDLEKR